MDPGELKKSRFKSARPPQRENKEWSLEVKPYHFASLFEVLPPSNSQVKSGIAFYNLSYTCRIRLVDVPDRSGVRTPCTS